MLRFDFLMIELENFISEFSGEDHKQTGVVVVFAVFDGTNPF